MGSNKVSRSPPCQRLIEIWKWLRRNISLITALISIIALIYTIDQYNITLQSFEREVRSEKISELATLESVLIEITRNYEWTQNYENKKDLYYVEKDGELIGGDLIIQDQLSVDMITDFLKTAQLKDEETTEIIRILWKIKGGSTFINNKIFDARMNVGRISIESQRRMQKQIFDSFPQLTELLVQARAKLFPYVNTLAYEVYIDQNTSN